MLKFLYNNHEIYIRTIPDLLSNHSIINMQNYFYLKQLKNADHSK